MNSIYCLDIENIEFTVVNGRSSVRTSHSTCTNENLGAHIFVQEVLGAHVKQTKIKLYLSGLQVLWSIMT